MNSASVSCVKKAGEQGLFVLVKTGDGDLAVGGETGNVRALKRSDESVGWCGIPFREVCDRKDDPECSPECA